MKAKVKASLVKAHLSTIIPDSLSPFVSGCSFYRKWCLNAGKWLTVPEHSTIVRCFYVSSLFPSGEVLRLGRMSGHTVNGGWSSWSSWSQCSRDCSRGIRSRKRTCSSPEPKYGGQTCLGPAQEYQECNITPCPGKLVQQVTTKQHWNNKKKTHRDKNSRKNQKSISSLAH